MMKFPANLHSFRKTVLGDNIISLSIDSSFSDDIKEIISDKAGTQYMVYLEDVNYETSINEDSKELKERFMSKLHLLLGQLAKITGKKMEDHKKELREELKKKGIIKESTTELDTKGLAIVCNIVEKWING